MGETAGLVATGGWETAQALAATLRQNAPAGVEDVVPAAASLGVVVDPETAEITDVLREIAAIAVGSEPGAGRTLDVDVCFDGEDLDAVAAHCGLSAARLVATVGASRLVVGWLGFLPGFPYLVGLHEPLVSVPRLPRPRPRVPGGSFALAGGFAGIYPQASPGGWNVLGRTAIRLFDVEAADPARFAPGDVVRIRPVSSLDGGGTPASEARRPLQSAAPRRLTVLQPGTRTLVQDAGRRGVAHLGVPRAGPLDPLRHRIANLAVGNAETSAALEVTMSGPTLRLDGDAFVALVGDGTLSVDGRQMPTGGVLSVMSGQRLSVGPVRAGAAAYLAVSGGLDTPLVLGSRATDASSGLAPGPLVDGDELALGPEGRARGRFFPPVPSGGLLELLPGPEGGLAGPARAAFRALLETTFEVAPESDRVGTRLRPLERSGALRAASEVLPAVPSRAMVTGAVQLPPDGCPIVLGPDHGTVGGYPVVGVLARRSASSFGQLRAGDVVGFTDAVTAGYDLSAAARRAVAGWMPGEARRRS